jgi:hypothetical protein
MKAATSITALAVLLLAAGCGQQEAAQEPTSETVAMDPNMDHGPAGMGQTAQLEPVNDSGIAGEATVTDRGTESEIMVRLTGAPANSTHPGHIHQGTCAAIGTVVQPLQPITTDATGTGTMTTSVAIAAITLGDGQHIIVYHGEGGAPATCAQIPGHMM